MSQGEKTMTPYYEHEERAAIVQYDAGKCRQHAERVAGLEYDYTTPQAYLQRLIDDREPLIHLFGQNPHTVLVRSLSSYEPESAKTTAWMYRAAAERALRGGGYYHYCNYEIGTWIAKVFRRVVS